MKRRLSHANFVGTPQYMAPECVHNKNNVSKGADIWSLGCMLYQLVTGLMPFRGGSDYLVFRRSTECKINLTLPMLTEDVSSLITACLKVNPEERPSIEEVLAHPVM